jgi:TolB-like protein/DNA-binding winged helix-turn-helix (wHTH) protein
MSFESKPLFEFGPFRLDPSERLLMRDHTPIHLPPKAFDSLALLVENQGHLLEKEELLKRVWPDSFVEESSLAQHISLLRKVLQDGDDGHGPKYIETVPRRGYRFIAKVREVDRNGGSAPVVPTIRSNRSLWAYASAVAGLGLLLSMFWVARAAWSGRKNSGPPSIQSLAVLPLQNLSGDPAQEYFADGLTEALITDLAKLPGLKVISRTSIMQYKQSHKHLPQIAQELGVDAIVEGAVLRSGNRIRITAQLVRAATDQHIWAESYERDMRDLVALQDEVSRSIAERIRREVAPKEFVQLTTSAEANLAAREDYLKGRYFWNRRTEPAYLKAIEYFQLAVSEDPNYAQAYAGLADAYALLGSLPSAQIPRKVAMPRAKEAALAALRLDDSLAEAHTSLAFVEMHYEWKFAEAEREFRRAVELNPNYATAHQWYAFDLAAMGKLDGALAEINRARQSDPLSEIINTDLAEFLYFARRYDEALQQARATLEMDPHFAMAHRVMERVYARKQMFPEAIAEGEQAVALTGEYPWMLLELAYTYAVAGKKPEMQRCLSRVAHVSVPRDSPSGMLLADIYSSLGDFTHAFEALEKGYRLREGGLILLNAEPNFDALRSDPRFKDLTRRVGLPN